MTDQPAVIRVLITGSRDWDQADELREALLNTWHDATQVHGPNAKLVVVHGACPTGADRIADDWARRQAARSPLVEVEQHRAQDFGPWPAAGPRRNKHMVELGANVCLAFIAPCAKPRCPRPAPHPSHGASGCADLAEKAGIPVRRFTA